MNYMEWKKRCISYFVSASVEVRATPVPDSFNLEIYDRLGQAINAAAIPTGAITLMLDVDCTSSQRCRTRRRSKNKNHSKGFSSCFIPAIKRTRSWNKTIVYIHC